MLPPPPPPPMWTGFYAGLNAGYNFGTNNNIQSIATEAAVNPALGGYNLNPFIASTPSGAALFIDPKPYYVGLPTGAGLALSRNFANTQDGFIGGGQIGYNYQWGSNFVIGIEADIQGTGIRGQSQGANFGGASNTSQAFLCSPGATPDAVTACQSAISQTVGYNNSANSIGATTVNAGVDWMGTARGRLGYLWTPTMLLYATGGLTYGGVYAKRAPVGEHRYEPFGRQLHDRGGHPRHPPVRRQPDVYWWWFEVGDLGWLERRRRP